MQLIAPNTYYWQITLKVLHSAAISYLTYQKSVYCQLNVIKH